MKVLTILEARVATGREAALEAAFRAATSGELPRGLMRTELLRDAADAARWRIQSVWESREALAAMRTAGTPAGVLMFRAAGAEPLLSIFEIVQASESGKQLQATE